MGGVRVTVIDLGIPRLSTGARPRSGSSREPPSDRSVRPGRHRPADLPDRPVQPPLHLLMPAEGLDWMPKSELLDDVELLRLIRIAVTRLGVKELRFTGGEPLLRRGLEEIIEACSRLRPRPDISLTTNGIGLARRARRLAEAGWTGSMSPSTPSTRTASSRSRDGIGSPTSLTASPRRRRRPGAGQGQQCADAWDQRRRGRRSASLRGATRVRAAVHRADAAGRQHAWQREAMVSADEILPDCRPSSG